MGRLFTLNSGALLCDWKYVANCWLWRHAANKFCVWLSDFNLLTLFHSGMITVPFLALGLACF